MEQPANKCAIILDGDLPLGAAANTAAILGVTLGRQIPEVVGPDVADQSGRPHLGIIEFPVPILRGDAALLRSLRQRLYEPEFSALTVVDFSDLAQGCKTYQEFQFKMGTAPESSLQYLGLAICGPKKQVNKLTGSLPLLR